MRTQYRKASDWSLSFARFGCRVRRAWEVRLRIAGQSALLARIGEPAMGQCANLAVEPERVRTLFFRSPPKSGLFGKGGGVADGGRASSAAHSTRQKQYRNS